MIALSRLLSIGILFFLVAFFVWIFALMKTAKKSDEAIGRMSYEWRLANGGRGVITFPPDYPRESFAEFEKRWNAAHPPLELYDQEEES